MIFDGGLMHIYNNLYGLQYLYDYLYRKIIVFDISSGTVIDIDAPTPSDQGFLLKYGDECIYKGYPAAYFFYATGAIRKIFTGEAVTNIANSPVFCNYLANRGIDYLILRGSSGGGWYKSTDRLANSVGLPSVFIGKFIESIGSDYTLFCEATGGKDLYTDTGTLLAQLTVPDETNVGFAGFEHDNYAWYGGSTLKHTVGANTTDYTVAGTTIYYILMWNSELLVVSITGTELVLTTCVGGTVTERLRIAYSSSNNLFVNLIEPLMFVFLDNKVQVINLGAWAIDTTIDLTSYFTANPSSQPEKFISIF